MTNTNKIYVTMNDTFMSGWGEAEGLVNKLVLECDSLEEANVVAGNAAGREEMKYVRVVYNKPAAKQKGKLVQFKTKEDMKGFYVPHKWGAPW
ncbi:hypothetical protein BCPG3_100 [Bacillus phage BCPG3]|uniref:Uncharacterized protein n=3 Tax=Wphvirus TaxID=1922327 RepID=W5QU93_9CAUD|nr:hypothetical protein BPS13_0100 [Bacillus phage BPS13]YP_009002985.1 hypothetical protein BPS10C_099 [Bacillus phage BPS10C]YP_009282212.1 hypothetical protein SALINJAH_258 [Bacillus phage SalinJah]QQO38895.1 hypothetical protein BCPG1_164 [Bacillus phage BCPG1]QSJ04417.1 hypothetical protein BCPG3_100 [Bacillus phage BCPG3]QSJ04628.1 hypothetical protein BCP18_096 [Bacillus phage BCP18]AEZ50279.1 hypothetical protein BPS13_0100 [Bacillus phage BPS13]AGI12096.1 hypothetical protein BPS10C